MPQFELTWEWDLAGPPEALWRWVADTDFINRAAGLPPVSYRWEPQPGGTRRRVASSRLGPLPARWIEAPFDWVQGQNLGVHREFLGGPVRAYTSRVTLTPGLDGTTRLTHQLRVQPRLGLLAPVLKRAFEGTRPGLDKAYRAAEAAALAESEDRLLGDWLPAPVAALEAEGVDEALASRLTAYMLHAPERQVAHLRPFGLADAWGLNRPELLAACMAGVRAGVLTPRWALECPHCRGAKGVAGTLAGLFAEGACEDCQATFAGALDRHAELAFAPAAAVRELTETLFCVAGPRATPHVLAQGELAPGAQRLLEVGSVGGAYRLTSGKRTLADIAYDPAWETAVAGPFDLSRGQAAESLAGGETLAVALVNRGPDPLPYALEAEWGAAAACPVTVAVAHPDFARTFPGQGLAAGRSFGVETLTVLVPRGLTDVASEAAAYGGFAVATGGGTGLAFYNPGDALTAALALVTAGGAAALGAGEAQLQGAAGWPEVSGAVVEAAREAAETAPVGTVVLSPALAEDAALRFHLMLAGWADMGELAGGAVVFGASGPPPSALYDT